MYIPRRSFLRYASLAAAGQTAGLSPFGALNALAAGASDYKALVCIFLFGGNDTNNVLIPYDSVGYQNYASLRGHLSLAQGSLLPVSSSFALNPNLPEIQQLLNSKEAAFVANVGTLVRPLTRASYLGGSAVTPQNLFSHADQQSIWQTCAASSSTGVGWGGRMADVLQGSAANLSYPVVTSVAGSQVFCTGSISSSATIVPGGRGGVSCWEGDECTPRLKAAQQMLTLDSGLTLVQADEGITQQGYSYNEMLTEALTSGTPLSTAFPSNNSLALQLDQIAQVIQVRSALGAGRQIFFASLGGFDTHSNQVGAQNALLAQMSSAVGAFYQATRELGVSNQVTTFTMSDFSRALQPNSASGSDHAWGSHHIVLGGAVKGGEIYGTFPTLALGGPDDAESTGRWIPTTAAAQYAATLASWFGVSDANLNTVLPTLSNFAVRNVGFLA